jgi:hypothetical protein
MDKPGSFDDPDSLIREIVRAFLQGADSRAQAELVQSVQRTGAIQVGDVLTYLAKVFDGIAQVLVLGVGSMVSADKCVVAIEQIPSRILSDHEVWVSKLAIALGSTEPAVNAEIQLHMHGLVQKRKAKAFETSLTRQIEHATEWVRSQKERPSEDAEPEIAPRMPALPPVTVESERLRRKALLEEYRSATGSPSNKRIYEAKNSGIYKPEFYEWVKGTLAADSATTVNFERFLREKKQPIRRAPQS